MLYHRGPRRTVPHRASIFRVLRLGGHATPLALVFAALAGAAGREVYPLITTFGAGPVAAAERRRWSSVRPPGCCAASGACRGAGCPLVVALAGISPLLPGLAAYRGFSRLSCRAGPSPSLSPRDRR